MPVDRPAAAEQDALPRPAAPAGPFPALIKLARRSILVSVVIGVGAFGATTFALWQLREKHVDTALRSLQHLAYGLAEQTSRDLTEADQHLQRIVVWSEIRAGVFEDPGELQRLMSRNLSSIAQVASIAYVTPEGKWYQWSKGTEPAPPAFPDLGKAEGLTVLAGAEKAAPGIFLQRRVPPGRGARAGTLLMRFSSAYLEDLYRQWHGRTDFSLALLTSDHRPLLQYPPAGERAALDVALAMGPTPHAAGTRHRSAQDGRTYLISTQAVRGYPLLVRAALPEREALTDWTLQAAVLACATLVLALILSLVAKRHAAELERRAAAVGRMQSLQGALAIEEAKLQAIFMTALESMIVIDESGIMERVNPAAERALGYSADELIGRNVSMLMPQPHAELHDSYLQRYLETGVPRIIGIGRELTARRKDGTEFPIHLGVAEQRFRGYRRFTGTIRDISREKLADAVHAAETRIATVLASAERADEVAGEVVAALCGLGFAYGHWVVWDPIAQQWRVRGQFRAGEVDPERVEELARGTYGPGPDGVASRAWHTGDVVWSPHLEERPAPSRAAIAAAAGLHSRVAVPVRSGGIVVAVIELFSPQGDPRNDVLDSALRNVGLQVGQLLARFQAEQQLQAILRTVPSAVFQARVTERRNIALTYVTAQIEALWGVTAKELLARPRQVLRKIPREHHRVLLRALSRAVLRGSGWDVTLPIQKADGLHWMRVHAAPAYKAGELPVWDGIVSDVTEQKLAEQQIVRLNLDLEQRVEERTQELAELNRELEAFSESVSHDLRAPVRGMRSYAEILSKTECKASPEAREMIQRIVAQGEQMESLIEALLELSQITRRELRRTDTDMTAIAASVLEELERRDSARKVEWRIQQGMHAYADPRLMRVLYENLLANAWKFTRDRASARIDVGYADNPRRTFHVRDNGAGFDPAYAEKLFQPFQRLHPASQFEGTGIGLATVQRIVRRHGGRIWGVSKPAEGATFYFELALEGNANTTPTE
jgi:PAS domain S-box-containing protein